MALKRSIHDGRNALNIKTKQCLVPAYGIDQMIEIIYKLIRKQSNMPAFSKVTAESYKKRQPISIGRTSCWLQTQSRSPSFLCRRVNNLSINKCAHFCDLYYKKSNSTLQMRISSLIFSHFVFILQFPNERRTLPSHNLRHYCLFVHLTGL